VSISIFVSPSDELVDPFQNLARNGSGTAPPKKVEQAHPGTGPFAAQEILRGECQDPLLADTYNFGMILVVINRVEVVDHTPWEQRKDVVSESLFVGCEVFEEHLRAYFKRWDSRRRLSKDDMMWMRSGLVNLTTPPTPTCICNIKVHQRIPRTAPLAAVFSCIVHL